MQLEAEGGQLDPAVIGPEARAPDDRRDVLGGRERAPGTRQAGAHDALRRHADQRIAGKEPALHQAPADP